MKKTPLLFILLSAFHFQLSAQGYKQLSSSEILQAMHKLNTVGSVLYIAAHPDDENTRLLAYLANERKLRTGYLSITRGDGGQNLIGKEQGDLLGLIRTNELLAARRIDGAEQFFTRAQDFGYSKSPEETFAFWSKQSVLADVVFVIRRFKPDVIICRFPTTGEGGHGHHTASAILAMEAFDLAGDPSKFPEQLKYVSVWQPKSVYWNTFNFGSTNTTSSNQLKIDVGTYNPMLGKGYGEIAAASRSMHKSQGFGSSAGRGNTLEYFKWQKGDSSKSDPFEGIVQNWSRLAGSGKIQKLITKCIKEFKPANPEESLSLLSAIHKALEILDETDASKKYWKEVKLRECEVLMIACSGLWMEALATDQIAIPGRKVQLNSQVICRNKCNVKLNGLSYWGQTDSAISLELRTNELYNFHHKEMLDERAPFTAPYWLEVQHGIGMFNVPFQELIGIPEKDPYTTVAFDMTIQGIRIRVHRPVLFKYADPVKGELYRPVEILPPVTINFPEKVILFTPDATSRIITVVVKANADNISGSVRVYAGQVWESVKPWLAEIDHPEFKLAKKGDEARIAIRIKNMITIPDPSELKVSVAIDGRIYNTSIQRIEYDHIPFRSVTYNAEANLLYADIKIAGRNIGYIHGAGDDVPASLKQMGYEVTMLTDDLLETDSLSRFDAIVTGVRAFNTNDRLPLMHNKLMEYVKNGGNLIVQYNTNSRVGPLQSNIGPYPFTISRNRVTDETAQVKFVNDSAKVLNYPNLITSADFNGWIQERGIYFATQVDSNYYTVLRMNDPNEKPEEGSLIIAKYGKGNFVYTGLAFFRELPAGVPGAYRLFANLLSLPDNQ